MTRILVTNFHPKGGGGHVPYIISLTKHFCNNGNVVGVAAPELSQIYYVLYHASHPYLYKCDFPSISNNNFYDVIISLKDFREIVKQFDPDIIHTNGGDLYNVLCSHPFRRQFKIVRTHHAVKSIKNDLYHRFIYSHCVDQNIFVSDTSMRLCLDSGISLPNSIVIGNGIDTKLFMPTSKDEFLAKELGIDYDTFCFGSCAGTMPYKRVDTIIKAARLLSGERKFAIIVLGDEGFGNQLRDLAAESGTLQFIYGGFHRNVIPYVSLFDVGFVLSDSVETISFAAREMMAMGKPLISSSYSGLSENITDNVNGFLVEPGDIDGIAAAMRKFLNMQPERLNEFSRKAREKALRSFGIQGMLTLHSEIYSKILIDI